jgi:FkbM family methyltransferase
MMSASAIEGKTAGGEAPAGFGAYRASPLQQAILWLARVPPLYRGTLRPFWTRLLNRIRPGPVDVTTVYGRFRVYPTTNLVESALLLHPRYNAAEMAFLQANLPRAGVFLDIGANIGLYSVAMGNYLSAQGQVVAIEPNPVCCERLRFNCQVNGLRNCKVFQFAAGDYSGRARLAMEKNDLAIVATVRDDGGGDIQVRMLLTMVEQAGLVSTDALKIDVEGYEYAALAPFFRDAPQTLWPKAISLEHLGEKSAVLKLLEDCGYANCGRTRNNAFYRRSGGPVDQR